MGYSDHWKKYESLRLRAFLGLLVAGYVARLPHDLNRVANATLGRGMSQELVTNLTWAMFPVAVLVLGVTAGRWLWFACPRCEGTFFGFGPAIGGRNLFVNPLAGACKHCQLKMGAAVSQGTTPANVVPFDELVRMRLERLDQKALRKEA